MPQGPFLRKYGAAATIDFQLFEVDGVDFRVDAVHASGDTVIMKDEGAEANTTNGFTDEGTGYSLVLTATEMQAARVVVYVIDQTATKVWLDTALVIETYGNASAMHAVDLDDSVRAGLTALPNAAADAAGGLPISDAGALDLDALDTQINAIETDTQDIQSRLPAALVSGRMSSDAVAISGSTTAADVLQLQMEGLTSGTASAGAAGSITIATGLGTADDGIDGSQVWIHTGTGLDQIRQITAYNRTTGVATISPNWTTTPDGTSQYIVLPAAPAPTASGSLARVDLREIEGVAVSTTTAQLGVNIVQISTDATAADNAEAFFDGTGYAGTNNVIPTVTTLTGHTAQTADHTANISAILTDTGTTLETHLTDIKGGTFSGATDSLEAIRDRGDAAWTTGGGGANPTILQNTTIATLASQTSFTLTAGSTDDDAYNGCLIIVEDSATSTQKAVGYISDYTGSTKTVTLKYDPAVFTMAVGDTVDVVAVPKQQEVDTTLVSGDATAADNLELDYDGTGYAKTNSTVGTVSTLTGHTVQTGDSFARLGAPAGASVSADIAAIEAQTDDIGAAGAGLTAVPWNAAWDAEVQSEVNDALVALGLDHLVSAAVTGTDVADNSIVAYIVSKSATADWDSYANTTDSLEANRDSQPTNFGDLSITATTGRVDVGEWLGTAVTTSSTSNKPEVDAFSISDDATAANLLELSASEIISGSAQTGTLSTTQATTDLSGYADDQLIGRTLIVTSGNAEGEATDITDYANASGLLTFTALTTAMANADTFIIV